MRAAIANAREAAAVPKKDREEQRVQHDDIDGLHGGDAPGRREAAEGAHDEGREGEEDPSDQAGTEG
jgi:hypothetical protein